MSDSAIVDLWLGAFALPGWAWPDGLRLPGYVKREPAGWARVQNLAGWHKVTDIVPDIDDPATWGHLLKMAAGPAESFELAQDSEGWRAQWVEPAGGVVSVNAPHIGRLCVAIAERRKRWAGGGLDD